MSNDQKTELLFKQFNNVVNARQEADFSTTTQNKFPFRNYVNNKEIFSNDIPDELSNITFTNSFGVTSYGCEALDFSFNQAGQAPNTTYNIPNTDLTFFYRVDLVQAIPQTNRTWYLPDISNNNFSSLNDTIPYNYDPSFNSYKPLLYGQGSNIPEPLFSTNGGNLKWLIDYKSGFVEFYGDDIDIANWLTINNNNNNPPRISLIKYTGPKGAAGGSGGGGSDASFNNVDISGDLNVANLTVTESASLPKDTLIQPIFYKVAGSNISTHPFFDKEYAQTQSYNALCLDPSKNLITSSDWITIARVGENISTNQDGRADALFKISHPASGRHETITFIASFKFAEGLSINVLQHDWYSGPNFKALRIMYEGTYDGAVLQLKCTNSAFNPAGRLNPLQIYIKDDHDYPGWQQNTFDVSGSIILDGREAFYALPNNNPESQGPSGGLFTNEFLLDDLDWNPGSGNANQITTNPARFTRQLDVGGNITTDSSVGATVNIVAGQAVQGQAGVFDGLTVNTDAEVGRFLTVNGDGYVSGFETTGFQTQTPTRPYLAEILLPIGANTIKNTAAKALFELIVSDQDPADENSSRNHVIVGTITSASTAGTTAGDSSYGLMLNILHSSWCDRTNNTPEPLVSRVFIQGQNSPGPPISNVIFRLWIESPVATLGYVSFKLKDNGINTYATQTTRYGLYWRANFGLANFGPGGPIIAEAIIPNDKNSFTSLGADQVDIPNLVSSNLEIGDSNNNISFKAHQFTLSGVANNNWFTIARLGTDNTNSSAQNRGVAVIEIYNRQSIRHQCVRMFVSQIFDSGGSIEAYNVGYNTGGLQYQTVRIVTGGTYDGALLQVKAGPGIQNGVSYPHYVNLMLSTNDPGWEIIDDESVVGADNNPLIYSGPNNNGTNTYSQPSQGWTEISLLNQFGFTNTQGPRAYTGKITTLPTTFQGARVQVRGENITAFNGNVGTVGGVVSVQDASSNNDITMSLDPSGNGIISNTNSSNDKSLSLISDGNINISSIGVANNNNIILDNTTGGTTPFAGDIIGRSRKDIQLIAGSANAGKVLLQTYGTSANTHGIQLVHYNTTSASIPYTMKWSSGVGGLSVGTHDVVDVKNILGDDSRTSDMTIRADNKWNSSTTRAQAKSVSCGSPFKILDAISSDITSSLNNNNAGTMLFDVFLSSIVLKPSTSNIAQGTTDPVIAGTATEITLWDKLSLFDTGGWLSPTFGPSGTPVSYTKGNIAMRNLCWPLSASASNPINVTNSTIYEFYSAPFDGYIVGVDFGGTVAHQNTPTFSIRRTNTFFTPAGSRLVLEVGVGGFTGTISEIGTILTGPGNGQTGTVSTNNIRWRFTLNPSQNRITFKQGQALDFRVRFINNYGASDEFKASWKDLTTYPSTFVNINLNLVYNIPH